MPPLNLQQAFSLVLQQQQAGNLREAEGILRQILAQDPNQPDALHMLGLLAHQAGHSAAGVELIGRAIAINPANPAFHGNLGLIFKSLGQIDNAMEAFRGAATLRLQTGQHEQAADAFGRMIALRPDNAAAHHGLGVVLLRQERFDEAIAELRQAVELSPSDADAHNNLAEALNSVGQPQGSIESVRTAHALRPDFPEAYYNLGVACGSLGRTDDAIAAYRQALALNPNLRQAAWNLPLALLLKGDYRAGWRAFEERRRLGLEFPRRPMSVPLWDGSDLAGRRILIHPEKGNGFGEVIQLARFVPVLAARGAEVFVECQPQLEVLLHTLPGVSEVIAFEDDQTTASAKADPTAALVCDMHCPFMSLPARLDVTLETVGEQVPYLFADPAKAEDWRVKLATGTGDLKVGLVWAGRAQPPHRSIEPALLAPLGNVPGVRLYSLQKQDDSLPASQQRPSFELTDLAADLQDFSDTAALLMNLDLLITIDTAIAHLAGAMGRPVWMFLRGPPDWRWLEGRTDSPWYPSMTLFRQTTPLDWRGPIEQLAAQLRTRAAAALH